MIISRNAKTGGKSDVNEDGKVGHSSAPSLHKSKKMSWKKSIIIQFYRILDLVGTTTKKQVSLGEEISDNFAVIKSCGILNSPPTTSQSPHCLIMLVPQGTIWTLFSKNCGSPFWPVWKLPEGLGQTCATVSTYLDCF